MDQQTNITDILGLGKVGEKGLELAGQFLERVFGPASDALGDAIAHPIKEWHKRRVARGMKVVTDAAAMVAAAGQEANAVPGRVLWPILERASLEEDPDLAGRWAALLANASIGKSPVLPAYVDTLSCLSPLEATILNVLNQPSVGSPLQKHWVMRWSVHDHSSAALWEFLEANYQVLMENLHRMGLIFPTYGGRNRDDNDPTFQIPIPGRIEYNYVSITQLGKAFVEACQPPKSKETDSGGVLGGGAPA